MALYTFGGTPASVLTTETGDVVPDYPVTVRVAGTGALVTALFEADGITPIAQLRSNPDSSNTPGAIRVFKAQDVPAIEYEYNGPNGVVRWYEAGRELASQAHELAQEALPRTGGTMTGTLQHQATSASAVDDAGIVTGDTQDRYRRTADGTMSWGPGNGARDVTLARTDAGTLTLTGNLVVTGQGGSSIRAYTPQAYGAKGDGTTNDAPAIQQALNAARNAGGGWVIVSPGTYRLETLPLRIYRNTRLTLLPGATFVRAAGATLLLNGDASQEFGLYSGHGNIVIEGGRWEMQALAAGLTASRMCISLGHAENITIRDVEIRDTPGFHAIEVNACRHVRIENSRFLGYVDPGGRDLSEAIQIDLAGSSSHFGGFGPYDNTHCYDVSVTGCHFGSSGTAGTVAWPRGIGSHAAFSGMWHERIRIENNDFSGCGQYAVGGYSWSDVVITGNTVQACGAGFWLRVPDTARSGFTQDCFNATITGNVIYSSVGYDDPIIIQGETGGRMRRVTISGNTIDASVGGQNGIRLQYAEEYAVTGNTVHDCAGSGISLFDANDGAATGNRVDNVGVHGIMTDTSTNVLVAANHISICGTNGLYAIRGGTLKWDGNFIRGAGRTDGTGFGMRASTSVVGLTITNNTYRKFGSGNEAVNAIGLTNTVSGVRRFGNDVIGQGNPTAIVDSSPTPNLSPYDTGA